jgi:acetylglutamate kinase
MNREEILKNASGYIEKFKDKIFVIKYGGSILDDEEVSNSILDDIICLHQKRIKAILVHGGGAAINRLMQEKGKEPRFINGLRITDKETAHIVDEALTSINISLVERIRSKGVEAEALVSREKLTIKGKKKIDSPDDDFVGDVASVDIRHINETIAKGAVPVVSPIGVDEKGTIYNINADLAAAEIAASYPAEKFIMLTNVKGVMRKGEEADELISTLKEEQAQELIEKGVIGSGMIPKVQAGIIALDKGVNKVHIISGRISHSLLTEVFTDEGIGTEILR